MEPTTLIEQSLFSTVRIELNLIEGGKGYGTGFLFTLREGPTTHPFVVTNRHVVDSAKSGRFFLTRQESGKPALGKKFDAVMENAWESEWCPHPSSDVDLAVMPFGTLGNLLASRDEGPYIRAIGDELIPSEEQTARFDALEEVVFIGYPNGMFDSKNLLPIIRRGTTASHPAIDYEGRAEFLIDASVFPGSSGSPVLICNQGSWSPRGGGLALGGRVVFLGVISKTAYRIDQGEIRVVPVPTAVRPVAEVKQMIDIGYVVKARAVREVALHALEIMRAASAPRS